MCDRQKAKGNLSLTLTIQVHCPGKQDAGHQKNKTKIANQAYRAGKDVGKKLTESECCWQDKENNAGKDEDRQNLVLGS